MITTIKEFILIKENNNNNYIDLKTYDLNALFDKINKECFNNELKRCPIILKSLKNVGGNYGYKYEIKNINYYRREKSSIPLTYDDKITISTFLHWTEQKLKNVLCHEMLHYYVSTNWNPKSGHDGHWYNGMNRINALNIGYTITQNDDDITDINTNVVKPLSKEIFFFTGKYQNGIFWATYDYDTALNNKEAIIKSINNFKLTSVKFYTTKSIISKKFTKFTKIGKFNISYSYIATYNTAVADINSIINDPTTKELTDF